MGIHSHIQISYRLSRWCAWLWPFGVSAICYRVGRRSMVRILSIWLQLFLKYYCTIIFPSSSWATDQLFDSTVALAIFTLRCADEAMAISETVHLYCFSSPCPPYQMCGILLSWVISPRETISVEPLVSLWPGVKLGWNCHLIKCNCSQKLQGYKQHYCILCMIHFI